MSRMDRNRILRQIGSPGRAEYVNALFSGVAPRYSLVNRFISAGSDVRIRRLAARSARIPPGSSVLDLGAGTGEMALAVLREVPGSRVTCLDACREMMDLGRHSLPGCDVQWVQSDARHLPFPASFFDSVTAAFAIRNMAEPNLVFAEILRVLRPNGSLVILDMVRPSGALYSMLWRIHFRGAVPIIGRVLGKNPEVYRYLGLSIERFRTSSQLGADLRTAGFEECLSKDLMFGTVVLWVGTKPAGERTGDTNRQHRGI